MASTQHSQYNKKEITEIREEDVTQTNISKNLESQQEAEELTMPLSRITTHDLEKRPNVFKTQFQEIICIFTLAFAPACITMSMGAYTVSTENVMKNLNIKGSVSTWLVGAIGLANGSTIILMGSLSDAIGRRNCILVGYFLYAVFSLIGGFMNSLVSLCIMRAISGTSICLALTSSYGIIGATYAEGSKRKNRCNSVVSAGNPLGTVIGNMAGAICIQLIGSWRDCHYFFSILYVLLTGLAWYSVPKDKECNFTELKKIVKNLDYFGGFLSTSGFTLLCFSLTQVDITQNKWHTVYIITLLIVGALLIASFLCWEVYATIPSPLIPMRIFQSRNFSICAGILFLESIVFSGVLTYYTVQYFVQILNNSPVLTATKMLPGFVVGIGTNVIAAFILHLVPGKLLMIISMFSYLGASIIWSTMDLHRNYFLGPFWAISLLIFGADMMWNIVSLVTYASVTKDLQSSASGLSNMITSIASVIGLAISSAIISATNADYGTDKEYDDLGKLFNGYKSAYYFAVGISGLASIISCFLQIGKFKHEMERGEEEQEEV